MCLAQADTAVKKERIVGFARRLGNGERGGVGEVLLLPTTKVSNVLLGLKCDFATGRRAFVRGSADFILTWHGRRTVEVIGAARR